MINFNYPVGYHKFHRTKIINYQLNRWYSFGYTRLEDCIESAGRTIIWRPFYYNWKILLF